MSRQAKRARGAESRRRAGTYLAALAWLEGYPDGDRWRQLDGTELAVDGALVARTRRAARTLLREHREALAAQVGDVDRWWIVVDAILAWCAKPAGAVVLAETLLGTAPPRLAREGRALVARAPELGDAVHAASVAWALQPADLGRVLGWLAATGPVRDTPTTIQLARLALVDAREVEAVRALLAVDAPEPQPLVELVQHALHRVSGKQGTQPAPAARSPERVLAWLAALGRRDRATQARTLAVLATIELAEALAPWVRYEREAAPRIERALAFAAREREQGTELRNQAALIASLERLRAAAPPGLALAKVLEAIDHLAAAAYVPLHRAATRLLAALPPDHGAVERVRLLQHLSNLVGWDGGDETRRFGWLWEGLAAALEAGADPGVLRPWRESAGTRSYLDVDLVEDLAGRPAVDALVRVLVVLAGQVDAEGAERAATLLAAGVAESEVPAIVRALAVERPSLRLHVARAAGALAVEAPATLPARLATLAQLDAELGWHEGRALAKLVERAARTGAGWLVEGALDLGHGPALARAAVTYDQLPAARRPPLVLAAPEARWIARYPSVLHAVLARLAAVDPDAEATAKRRLATELPDPADLREELATLRARAPLTAAQAKRVANLERRLASPEPPSPRRLARLADKLAHAAVTIGLARFTSAIRAIAIDRLVRGLGLPRWPDWPLEPRLEEALIALLALEAQDRALAGRLVRARMGPPPWDLRDDPANRAFLDGLRARGVDPAPWLDPTPRRVKAGDGQPLDLELCGDPLEVFQMGAHFDTCLSPHGGNFFSVVANAADINKRVVYARRDGKVVGRCLLALTDHGALLAFHPYCHLGAARFDEVIRAFVLDLAARMHTTVVPRGTVPRLLARDWYDDGARDLVGRFAGLDAVFQRADTLAPEAFPGALREALAHPLDDLTLPMVLAWPRLRHRPALFRALVPALLACRGAAVRLPAAQLALAVGELALADRLLGDLAPTIALDDHAWHRGSLVAALRPVDTLARLRASRRRGVRRLADEDGQRLAVMGVALEALHRPRQAAACYRLALEHESWLRDELAPRLRRLEARQ